MITVREILDDRVAITLNDTEYVHWTLPELLSHLNEAAAAVINRRPEAGVRRTVQMALSAGSYQLLPDEATELIDVVRNINSDGSAGRAIRLTDRQLLDDIDPDWHSMKPVSAVKNYTFDKRAPKVFYVYPPAKDQAKIELIQAELPAEVASLDDELEMDRQYLEPLVSFVLYRALSKETEYANGQIAAAHYQAFTDALGAGSTGIMAVAPTGQQPDNSV